MAGVPTGCEDYDVWIARNASYQRYLEKKEREYRFSEATFEEDRDEQPPATA